MIGAVAGDIIGSVYEFDNHRSVDFPLFTESSTFTDDSVLTFATAAVLLGKGDYTTAYQDFARRYRGRGYGGNFYRWIYTDDPRPYNSFGNGSAMRVSPVGFAFDSLEETLAEAQRSAEVTHNHPEGIKGAQATAQVIFMSRKGASKAEIKREINQRYGYDLSRSLEHIREVNQFNETCQGSLPEAISVFLAGEDYEHTIRLAISIGGDTDTIACIAGGMAQAFYGSIPAGITREVRARLSAEFLQILDAFQNRFPAASPLLH
ncbi:MAG TPA: ADP-ribosylglycohydrolase family protein [Anaerolineaceae bacterium]|nr:ADP-ribosylglycohydrolase family protein [Anaerolineaceae bacterium]